MAVAVPIATAETRRAVLVGIQNYNPSPEQRAEIEKAGPPQSRFPRMPVQGDAKRTLWGPLDGPVRDIEAVRGLLVSQYGFKEVTTLLDQDATADAILSAIRDHLVEAARAGDVSVFYFAGHGSRMRNKFSERGMDQTIVPADSWRGTPDIRNKELARLYREAARKGIVFTVVADSCHSGGISRGPLSPGGNARMAPPTPAHVDDPNTDESGKPLPDPVDLGVLTFSAAQRDELAWETKDGGRGLFSSALIEALRSSPNERIDRIRERTRALMRAERQDQEPALEAGSNGDRMNRGIFGQEADGGGGPTIAAARVLAGEVMLQAGDALGLRPGCELKSLKADKNGKPVQLEVTKVLGLSSSLASVKSGDASSVSQGDLFTIDRWVAPSDQPILRVYMPPSLPLANIQEVSRRLAALQGNPAVEWIDDPTEKLPTHVLSWNGRSWVLDPSAPGAVSIDLGADPSSDRILQGLSSSPKARLFVWLPPASELGLGSQIGQGSRNSAISSESDSHRADYVLVGRLREGAVQYAWVMPGMTRAMRMEKNVELPERTDWRPVVDAAQASPASVKLQELALQLGRLRAWLKLASPNGRGTFPYVLAFRNAAGKVVTETTATMRGERYEVVLHAEPKALARFDDVRDVPRRWIYLYMISETGETRLLYPAAGRGNEGAHLPEWPDGDEQKKPAPEVSLRGIRVTKADRDIYVLLVSEESLPHPEVLEAPGVVSRGERGGSPLERFLREVGARTRGEPEPVPARWNLQRATVQCSPAAK